jgi:hypothetical protein
MLLWFQEKMLTDLNSFDPIQFLNVDISTLSEQEKIDLRTSLNAKIGEYVLLKLSTFLTEEQMTQLSSITDPNQMITTIRSFIPDADAKILQEVNNFKAEYDAEGKGGTPNG